MEASDPIKFSVQPLQEGAVHIWDWADRLDGWGWEFIRTVGNDGFAFIMLVSDSEGIDPVLRAMCRELIPCD